MNLAPLTVSLKALCSSPLLTFSTIVHSLTPLPQSLIQSSNSSSSSLLLFHCLSCTTSFLFVHLFHSFLNLHFSSSLQLSFLSSSVCLPPSYLSLFSLSFSVSCSIARIQEMVSFPIQGVGGVYSLSQTKRSLCESSKNTKKKRKADKHQKPALIRLSHTISLTHTHFTFVALTQHFPYIQ